MTLGKTLHVCSGLPGDQAHGIDMICLLGRWYCKGHSSLTQGSLCMFVQLPHETRASAWRSSIMNSYSCTPNIVLTANVVTLYQDEYYMLMLLHYTDVNTLHKCNDIMPL